MEEGMSFQGRRVLTPPSVRRGAAGSDTLSTVLRAVRLTGAVFFELDASAPWVAETPPAREVAPRIMPGVEHVIEYHLIKAGSCSGGIVGEAPVHLETGDIIVFPRGDAHVISSETERAEVISGFMGCDARPFNPLLSTLPRVIHVARRNAGNDLLEQLVELALAEASAQRAGGQCVLSHLSELLFVEVVRRYVSTLPPENVGWFAGLRDESIGRALGKLHDSPAHDWNLSRLAHEAGMSRSVLVERFTELVGMPPMQYLTRWRMQLAATLLASTQLNLSEVADRVGYTSEAALSRAYKRWVGVAPAEWRRKKRLETAAVG
jgi:AraC-like DNA-binding protein